MGDRTYKNVPPAKTPLEPGDFLLNVPEVVNPFGQLKTERTSKSGFFDPEQYKYEKGATPFADPEELQRGNVFMQPGLTQLGHATVQFGANFASAAGQQLANTFDLLSSSNRAKNIATGKDENFESYIGSISTKDMQDWANGVAQRYDILEKKEGAFDLTDPGWWAKQYASSGTSLGMAAGAAVETAAIESLTGGLGTAEALGKLGSAVSKILDLGKGVKGAEIIAESMQAAKGLKSAATLYGTLSRAAESVMEGQNTHQQIYDELGTMTKKDGTPFTEAEKQHAASEGAKRDYAWNMALMPLDILAYRMMVFNPVSGQAEGALEKGLAKVARAFGESTVGKAVGTAVEKGLATQVEGAEEGFQQIGQDEGDHYAKVVAGLDDGKSFVERLGDTVQTADFWNNYAGGVLASPLIGGIMNVVDNTLHGREKARIANIHKEYVANVGMMEDATQKKIKAQEAAGDYEGAAKTRKLANSNDFLSRLHFDEQTGKTTAFDSKMAYAKGVIEEIDNGKTTGLEDAGFFNTNPEQLKVIRGEFEQYVNDAQTMKRLYDETKVKYNKNFVPEITQDKFSLEMLKQQVPKVDAEIDRQRASPAMDEYAALTQTGKEIHDAEYQLQALKMQNAKLTNTHRNTFNLKERELTSHLIDDNNANQTRIKDRLDKIAKQDYEGKTTDDYILQNLSQNKSTEYQQAFLNKESLNDDINIQRKKISLWGNKEWLIEKSKESIDHAKTPEQVDSIHAELTRLGQDNSEVQKAAKDKKAAIASEKAVTTLKQPSKPVIEEPSVAAPPPGVATQSTSIIPPAQSYDELNQATEDLFTLSDIPTQTEDGLQSGERGGLNEFGEEDEFTHGVAFAPSTSKWSNEQQAKIKASVGAMIKGVGAAGVDGSFEDVVRHVTRLKGEEGAKSVKDILAFGWEASGKEAVDYNAIYDKLFGDPHVNALFEILTGQNESTPVEISKANDVAGEAVVAKEDKPITFDNNNQPVHEYTGKVTHEPLAKMSFSTRSSREIVKEEQGKVTVSHEYTTEEIESGAFLDSNKLLDPDKYNKDTPIDIRIPKFFRQIKIGIFNDKGSVIGNIPFGQWEVEHPEFPEGSRGWNDKVPMLNYDKGAKPEDKALSFVHDVAWYHPNRFDNKFPDEMEKAIANTRAIRDEVVASPERAVGGKILGKRQTTFAPLKTEPIETLPDGTKKYKQISLREANPESEILVASASGDSLIKNTGEKGVVYPSEGKRLVNSKLFDPHEIINVRRYGTDPDGTPTYMGFKTTRPKINAQAKESIIQAITIYDNSYENGKHLTPKQQAVREHIQKVMDLDIIEERGIRQYLQHFIFLQLKNVDKAKTNKDVENQLSAKLPRTTPYITIIAGGNIVFGQVGVSEFGNVAAREKLERELIASGMGAEEANKRAIEQTSTYSLFINPHSPRLSTSYITKLRLGYEEPVISKTRNGAQIATKPKTRLSYYETNVDMGRMTANKPVVTIDINLDTTIAAPSYKDYLLDNLQTDIRSINIGTKEKPNWVTNAQPIITYDTDKRISAATTGKVENVTEKSKSEENDKKVTKEEAKTTAELTPQDIHDAAKEAGIEADGDKNPQFVVKSRELTGEGHLDNMNQDQLRTMMNWIEKGGEKDSLDEIERKAQEELEKLLGRGFMDRPSFAPAPIQEGQIETIAKSIVRIGTLTPAQQADVVGFMYNKVVSAVSFEGETVPKEEIDRHVTESFEKEIIPIKRAHEEQLANLKKLLEDHPSLKDRPIAQGVNLIQDRLDKIESIRTNMSALKEATYDRVAKYTNIAFGKIENEDYDNDGSEFRSDHFVESLTESPDNKVSYTMRRFFNDIEVKDKSGVPQKGFLGLPIYEDSGDITRTLMDALRDTPSSFDEKIAKLEKIESRTWMKDVIGKLQGASEQMKNQFTTVMSLSSMRMKYSQISYDRLRKAWTARVYDTAQTSVAEMAKRSWNENLIGNSKLIELDKEGNLTLNKFEAQRLIDIFDRWTGVVVKQVSTPLNAAEQMEMSAVTKTKPAIFEPTGALLQELRTNLVSSSSRMKVYIKGLPYEITKLGNDKFQSTFFQSAEVKNNEKGRTEVDEWLRSFGITLSPETIVQLLTKGLRHNYQPVTTEGLFDVGGRVGGTRGSTNGLFGILYNKLKDLMNKKEYNFTEYGDSPLSESVVTSLANEEARYSNDQAIFGFRAGNKSYYAMTTPKFMSDRARDLKMKDSELVKQLKTLSYSSGSFILRMLEDTRFQERYKIQNDGAESIKEQGKQTFKDSGLKDLSPSDHEQTKITKFVDMTQGEPVYNSGDKEFKTYPDTNIPLRMGTMFMPTMSDKEVGMLNTTAVLNFSNSDLGNGKEISDKVAKVLYNEIVRPELLRMTRFHQNGGKTNIKAYDKGAGMFLMMPQMNSLKLEDGTSLIENIKNKPNDFTIQNIEANPHIMKDMMDNIKSYITTLTDEKIGVWTKNGYIIKKGDNIELKFFDKSYLDKFKGNNEEKVRLAAMDFVTNYLISNATSFMLYAGDPALYYKVDAATDSEDYMQVAKDVFVNIGKRLANQIAPRTPIANSAGSKYIQLFLADKTTIPNSDFLKRVTKYQDGQEITDKEIEILRSTDKADKAKKEAIANKYPNASGFFEIEGTDAQEYTTWKEHLDILAAMGKTPDSQLNITPKEIEDARQLLSSGKQFTEEQQKLVSKVMQPMKPVYTGQLYDPIQDVMRTMYIKSSSFPLYEQLTKGLEIDKLRDAMETLQDKDKGGQGLNVRASYQSANKLGAVANPISIWDNDGRFVDGSMDLSKIIPNGDLTTSSLVLNREGFGIQQDVPYKAGKAKEDTVTMVTQLMKLVFGDEVMNYSGYEFEGETYNGKKLHSLFTEAYGDLLNEKQGQLYDELGLDERGKPIDIRKTTDKLRELLKDEAIKRDYSLQDIEGLDIVQSKDGAYEFNLPLWSSANSNRYESMLNSIVTNRLVRMKFPGTSSVVGSEEGFRTKKESDLTEDERSGIVYTPAWNGTSLESNQIFVGSRLRDNEGNLIDLLTKEEGKYKYVDETKTGFRLKENMFDKELLEQLTSRTPFSGLQSGSMVEIAGFLPNQSGDLMILSNLFTKQKGLDFDIDKESGYGLWYRQNGDGKFEVLNDKHRTEILDEAIGKYKRLKDLESQLKEDVTDRVRKVIEAKIAEEKLALASVDTFFGNATYTDEEIDEDKRLKKMNSKINEKLLHNKIIGIMRSVYSHPEIQNMKINKTLNTDYTEEQATIIDKLVGSKRDNEYWTPLSDEYQKQKFIAASSGKIATGAYALDSTFHSQAQQQAIKGEAIQLNAGVGEDAMPKGWRFGKIVSNGKLGGTTTLDGSRSIADRIQEAAQTGVDNEKLQILGRVGINNITLDVDKVFNLLGIDKGDDVYILDNKIVSEEEANKPENEGRVKVLNSISFLFLSQPIIKEYVENIKNMGSIISDTFVSNKEAKVVEELLAKYGVKDIEGDKEYEYWEKMSDQMSTGQLAANLVSDKIDGELQGAILRRFIEMMKYGLVIRDIQTTINFKRNSLGKSFFDVIDSRQRLNALGRPKIVKDINEQRTTIGNITNADKLIGDYRGKDGMSLAEEESLKSKGYVDIGSYLVKPNTVIGSFQIKAISTAYNLWSRYFPYDSKMMLKVFKELIPIVSKGEPGSTQMVELKQKIFQHVKKYLAASNKNGVIGVGDNVNEERKRLYIDTDSNVSLARYTKEMKYMDDPAVNEFIKTNKLINSFEFDLNKDGTRSIIRYNNAEEEEFDEQYLYESLAQMMVARNKDGSRIQLPTIGNKSYTLDSYAQDLVAYTYLGNSTQEAIQIAKFIPLGYLDAMGFSAHMREINRTLEDDESILSNTTADRDTGAGTGNSENHIISEFSMQYAQSNPKDVKYYIDSRDDKWKDRVSDIKYKKGAKANLSSLESFTLRKNERPTFIRMYDNETAKGSKDQLYYFDGAKYARVPILGVFGMDEYQPSHKIGNSIVNGEVRLTAEPQKASHIIGEDPQDVFNINSGNIKTVLGNISDSDLGSMSLLAKAILPYAGDSPIKYASTYTDLVTKITYDRFEGLHIGGEGILINPTITPTKSLSHNAMIVLHEVVHSMTVNQIKSHIIENADGSVSVKAGSPSYISDIVRLYNNVRSRLDTSELKNILSRVQQSAPITQEERETKYGFSDIYEFMSMALVEPEFQRYLARPEFKQGDGRTLLDRFKDFISNVLTAIGVKFESDTAAAQAINSIFEFLEGDKQEKEEQDRIDRLNTEMADHAMNEASDNFDFFVQAEQDFDKEIGYEGGITDDNKPAFSPETFTGVEAGAFEKLIRFKQGQASTYRGRLAKIESLRKDRKNTTEQLVKLRRKERDIKLILEGSTERSIKGLNQEINELKKGVNVNAVSYYVEKDLKRLRDLAQSDDIDDLNEADKIIEFYDKAGTFKQDGRNPFFTDEDIFLKDENGKLTGDMRPEMFDTKKQYEIWRSQAMTEGVKVDKRKQEVFVQTMNDNPQMRKAFGDKQFGYEELTHQEAGLRDIDFLSAWTMEPGKGIFSHNGLIPQAMFSELSNRYNLAVGKSVDYDTRMDEISPLARKRLNALNKTLESKGIVGIRGISYQMFKEITKDGNETTGTIQRFTKEYADEQAKVLDQFSKDYENAKLIADYDVKQASFRSAFDKRNKWRKDNNIVVDVRRIGKIVRNPEFAEFKNEAITPTQIESHEKELKALLGERGFKEHVEAQEQGLRRYQSDRENTVESLMAEEGVMDYNSLSDNGKFSMQMWMLNNSPLIGYDHFMNPKEGRKSNNFMNYNSFIPKKDEHYNKTFAEVEKDVDENDRHVLMEFYDLIKEYSEVTYDSMSPEQQKKVAFGTVFGMEKSSAEIALDKNTGRLRWLFPAFSKMWERFRMDFGVTKQSEISYATEDELTGKRNYKVDDSFIGNNSKAIERRQLIESTAFMQAYNEELKAKDKERGLKLVSMTKYTSRPLSSFGTASLIKLAQFLHVNISTADIKAGRIDKIKARVGEAVDIGKLVRDFSIHTVVQSQSFDLPRVMKYYHKLALIHKAKNEALPTLEIMKKFYDGIQDPRTQNLGIQIYNKETGQWETKGDRERGKKQVEDWFQRAVLGNFGAEHFGVIGSKNEKALVGERIFTKEERKIMEEIDELLAKIGTEERDTEKIEEQIKKLDEDILAVDADTDAASIEQLKAERSSLNQLAELLKTREALGKIRTMKALFDNALEWVKALRLGWNLSSATTNLFEGLASNMMLGSTDEYFDSKELYYAYGVVKQSFVKNTTFGLVSLPAAKLNRILMDRYSTIQDNTNENQKASHKTYADKLSWAGSYAINQKTEYVNQSVVQIAMLRTLKIKGIDKEGNEIESSVWKAMIPSTGKLKDEFRSGTDKEKNIENWEEAKGEDYLHFKQKLADAIDKGHGNYDELRGMMAKGHTFGKAVMTFKTWMPMQLFWRFGVEQPDILSGKATFKGKFRSFTASTAGLYGAGMGFAAFGPVGAAIGGGLGLGLGLWKGQKSESSVVRELTDSVALLAKKMLGFPINFITNRNIIDTYGKGQMNWKRFSKEDSDAMRANMADLSINLAWIALMLIVKSIFWDDDKDKIKAIEDPEERAKALAEYERDRAIHNLLVNKLSQLSQQAGSYVNVFSANGLYHSTLGTMAVLQYTEDVGTLMTDVDKAFAGTDAIASGPNAGQSRLWNQSKKVLLPGMFKDGSPISDIIHGRVPTLGFGSQTERQFNPTVFDKWFKSEFKKDEAENKSDRAARKLELSQTPEAKAITDEKERTKEIKAVVDYELPTSNALRKAGITRDQYNEWLKEQPKEDEDSLGVK